MSLIVNAIRKAPHSVIVLLLTLTVFVLQILPIPGIFLMALGAPFWSILSVNIGFLLFISDVKAGRLPLWLIVVPIIYFGGFAALTTASHMASEKINREFAEQNSKIQIPFDCRNDVLVCRNTALTFNGESLANSLLNKYDLPVVYDSERRSVKRMGIVKYLSYRFEKIDPDESPFPAKQDFSIDHANGIFRQVVYEGPNRARKRIDRICWVRRLEEPSAPACKIDIKDTVDRNWFLEKRIKLISITDAGGKNYTLTASKLTPISWIPLPLLGYCLNDGNASWDNVSGFIQIGTLESTPEDVLACALHLRPASVSSRLDHIR
jgi:hypothetical protein